MGKPERQVSFAGGELSPMLWGRTDLDRYPIGARTLLNFIVTQHGPVVNRSGTQHVCELTYLSVPVAAARLVPFVVSETESYLLVFVEDFVHVIAQASDEYEDPLGTPPDVADPRHRFVRGTILPFSVTAARLPALRFAQVGAYLYVVSPDYVPRVITRASDGSWSYDELSFDVPDFPLHLIEPFALAGSVPVMHVGITGENSVDVVSGDVVLYSAAGDTSHPALEWTWKITRILRDRTTGTLYESAPYTIVKQRAYTVESGYVIADIEPLVAVYADWTQRFYLRTEVNPAIDLSEEPVVERTRVYRGRDGRFGYIGDTTGEIFIDHGETPDYSDPPPQETNPFKIFGYDAAGQLELLRTEAPSVVALHEGRLLLAATPERPTTVLASAYDDFTNHDEIPIPRATSAFTFRVSSLKLDKIQALVGRERLLILTSSAEYLAAGSGDGEVMTPTSVAVRQLSEHGSAASPAPVSISSSIFFMQAKGVTPRLIVIDRDGAQVIDISLMSRHLFKGHTIVDWAYAEHPYSVLWAVRDDGVLLSFTYQPDQNVAAWAQHEIADDGLVESVCCKPEIGEDGVYLVVNRDGVRTVERMAYREFDDVEQGIFLDRSVSRQADLDGMMTGEAALSPIAGTRITIWSNQSLEYAGVDQGPAWGIYFTDFADHGLAGRAISVANPTAGGERVVFRVGEWSSADSGYLAEIISPTLSEEATQELSDLIDVTYHGSGLWADAGDDFYLLYDSIDGLDHLEGETVTVVADGDVTTGVSVEAGTATLDEPARLVHVGRPYDSDFESLDAIGERGRQKTLAKVMLELEGVRGGSAGSTLDDLVPMRTRTVEEGYGVQGLKRLESEVIVKDRWRASGRCAFRQSDPLPCTILGITRDIEYGG